MEEKSTGTEDEVKKQLKILLKADAFLFFQIVLIVFHLLLGIKAMEIGGDVPHYCCRETVVISYSAAVLMFWIMVGLFLRARFTIYLAVTAIIIACPVTIFYAVAVLLLGHMGLVIMGMGGLFVLLEIGTIIFIRLALKQEKPDA